MIEISCCWRSRSTCRATPAGPVPLHRALALAKPEGYLRVFVDEGGPMAALLAAGGGRARYVQRLLAAFDAAVGEANRSGSS